MKSLTLPSRRQITVCVCTFRRYRLLAELLHHLGQQTIGTREFEVLVVDNTPQGEREEIPADATNLSVHVIYTSPPGLSRARNEGIARCTSEFIAFIDDDAQPSPGWLKSIVTEFARSYPPYSVLGGPIRPIWHSGRPSWIPQALESALTILDLGTDTRELAQSEFLFGTNIAFRIDDLRGCGGFDEALGRQRGALLSGEEIKVQELLRAQGKRIGYVADATVRHHVHHERLSQDWFRKRFAWQGVSDASSVGDEHADHWSRAELQALAEQGGDFEALTRMFRHTENPAEFRDQLRALRAFVTHALRSGREIAVAQEIPEKVAKTVAKTPNQDDSALDRSAATARDWVRWTSMPLDLKYIFLEAASSHGYLYGLFGNIPGSALLEFPVNPWSHELHHKAAIGSLLEDTFRVAHELRAAVVIMTIDPFLFGNYAETISELIQRYRVTTFGLLHKIALAERQRDQMLCLGSACRRIISYLDYPQLPMRLGLSNLVSIHHHDVHGRVPTTVADRVRHTFGWGNQSRLIIAFLGEFRDGKGLEFVTEAIGRLDPRAKNRVAFLFAGRGLDSTAQRVAISCSDAGVAAHVDIRFSAESYRVLAEVEMDAYITVSHTVLLPYTGDQIDAMSGAMPSFVVDGKPVIASRASYVGDLVSRHCLGEVFDFGDATSFNLAIMRILENGVKSYSAGSAYDAYRRQCSSEAVLSQLMAALES